MKKFFFPLLFFPLFISGCSFNYQSKETIDTKTVQSSKPRNGTLHESQYKAIILVSSHIYNTNRQPNTDYQSSAKLVSKILENSLSMNVPPTINSLLKLGKTISFEHIEKLETGDLLFFSVDENNSQANKVGVYITEGKFITSLEDGTVLLNDLNKRAWSKNLHYIKRL